MTTAMIEQRLRTLLLLLALLLCLGTPLELALTEHWESALQLIPFGLCAAGAVALAITLLRPTRRVLVALRAVMVVLLLGSALGVYEHLEHNIGFALEIQPNAAISQVFFQALAGANPLLAPGVLAAAAAVALIATYYHPALGKARKGNG
jgi:hypothetical protein